VSRSRARSAPLPYAREALARSNIAEMKSVLALVYASRWSRSVRQGVFETRVFAGRLGMRAEVIPKDDSIAPEVSSRLPKVQVVGARGTVSIGEPYKSIRSGFGFSAQ
jgi:hypothetical protein